MAIVPHSPVFQVLFIIITALNIRMIVASRVILSLTHIMHSLDYVNFRFNTIHLISSVIPFIFEAIHFGASLMNLFLKFPEFGKFFGIDIG